MWPQMWEMQLPWLVMWTGTPRPQWSGPGRAPWTSSATQTLSHSPVWGTWTLVCTHALLKSWDLPRKSDRTYIWWEMVSGGCTCQVFLYVWSTSCKDFRLSKDIDVLQNGSDCYANLVEIKCYKSTFRIKFHCGRLIWHTFHPVFPLVLTLCYIQDLWEFNHAYVWSAFESARCKFHTNYFTF